MPHLRTTHPRRLSWLSAAVLCSFAAGVARADPPRRTDVLVMRSAGARDAEVGELSRVKVKVKPKLEAHARAAQSAPSAAVVKLPEQTVTAPPKAAAPEPAAAQAEVALVERCYELAKRSDPSLTGPVTVHVSLDARGLVSLQVKDENLGNHHYVRCLQRELGRFPVLPELPAPDAATRVVVLGGAAPAPAGGQALAAR